MLINLCHCPNTCGPYCTCFGVWTYSRLALLSLNSACRWFDALFCRIKMLYFHQTTKPKNLMRPRVTRSINDSQHRNTTRTKWPVDILFIEMINHWSPEKKIRVFEILTVNLWTFVISALRHQNLTETLLSVIKSSSDLFLYIWDFNLRDSLFSDYKIFSLNMTKVISREFSSTVELITPPPQDELYELTSTARTTEGWGVDHHGNKPQAKLINCVNLEVTPADDRVTR